MKRRRSLSMLLTSIAVACGAPISPPSSSVQIRVVDEAKEPVAGAEIAAGGGTVIARTDSSGLAEITLSGAEGATFHVEIRCPTLYRSPSAPVAIRRFDGRGSSPEYVARCSKTRHTLVVAVRTQGATNMPVYHLGKEVARTDESGSAHVLIEGEVHERVDLQVVTSDPKHAKLHPQNPTGSFEVLDRDEVKIFDVKFTHDVKPVARSPVRTGPKAF